MRIHGGSSRGLSASVGNAREDSAKSGREADGVAYTDEREAKDERDAVERFEGATAGGGEGDGQNDGAEGSALNTSGTDGVNRGDAGAGEKRGIRAASLTRLRASNRPTQFTN